MEPKERLEAQIKVLAERVDSHTELPNRCFESPALSDFKIRAGGKTFYVSKYQLALKSRVFAKMFEVDMNEKKEGVMKLDDDPDVVEAMLKYMYMYKKVEGIELARKVVQLAHRYEINELKDQCELEMVRGLKKEDAEDILMLSWELKLSTLYWKCTQVLFETFNGFDHDITFNSTSNCCFKKLVVTNHSNVEIAFKVYTHGPPLLSHTAFRTIGPSEKLTLSAYAFSGTCNTTAVVYYVPYVPGLFDYDNLHRISSARFFTLHFRKV